MKKNSKIILVISLVVFISIQGSVNAHSPGTTFNNYGHEGYGYIIRPTHHNANQTILFSLDPFDPYVTDSMIIQILQNGINKLNQHGTDIRFDSTATNKVITTFYDSSTDDVAWVSNYSWNSSTLHTTHWIMTFNRAKNGSGGAAPEVVVAHEFCHTFGLLDLYMGLLYTDPIDNRDKLMFGVNSLRTATQPTASEKTGIMTIVLGD